jgi:hypothetical protein
MEKMHHKAIKRFKMSGIIHDESSIGRLKIEYIRLLKMEMFDLGYVPRLDIDADFTIKYNKKTESFTFKLSVYGTYTGKSKIECVQGIDGTTLVPTLKSRSSELSQDQALQ